MRNGDLLGRALLLRREREGNVVGPQDVTVNSRPVRFETWEALRKAPDPPVLVPRAVSAFSFLTGDNAEMMVVSEGVLWAQPRRFVEAHQYGSLSRDWTALESQAYYENAITKAAQQDNA